MSTAVPQRVAPSREDPLVAAASELVGGPAGKRRGPARSWWTPIRVLLVFVLLTSGLAILAKAHCHGTGWAAPAPDTYVHQCYSDIPLLYSGRALDERQFPYVDELKPGQEGVEYPVVTGVVMGATAKALLKLGGQNLDPVEQQRWYFDINLLLLVACFAATVVATALTVGWRPWDAALVALAPGIALAGTINWDLWAVMLTAVGMLAWARKHPALAGVLLGLATAAKFYPLLILGPLVMLCLRAGRLRQAVLTIATAVAAWLAINVPFMISSYDEWKLFYEFSETRTASFGSIWFVGQLQEWPLLGDPDKLNAYAAGSFVVCCAAIAMLILFASRRPRLAQVAFLVVAAFLLTNKVYSPQFVVWLIPLAALARPRWRDFLIWQICEIIHFFATWLYLVGTTSEQTNRALGADQYTVAVLIHVAGTLWFAGMVLRDILYPSGDPIRADGADDPGGGVLDGRADWWDTDQPFGQLDDADRPREPVPV